MAEKKLRHTADQIDKAVDSASSIKDVAEDGFHVTDGAGNVGLRYDSENGFDCGKLSPHVVQLIKDAIK